MLVEFKFSNFRSFKEEANFSMEPLSQNGSNPNTIITNLKKVPQLYRTAGIFGANASGKSNIILALTFLKFLVEQSAKSVVGDEFPQEFYAFSDETSDKPISLRIQFIVESNLFEYEVSILKNIVQKESLYYYPIAIEGSAKPNRIFERSNINGKIEFEKSKGILQSWSNETLDNRLFLSEIVNNRKCTVKEVLDVYNWITQTLSIRDTRRMNDSFSLTKILEGDGADIIKLMKKADLGLEDISVKETPIEEIIAEKEKINDKLRATLLNILAHGKGKALEAKSFHKTEDGKIKSFDFNSIESLGTKRFLTLSGYLLDALKKGKVFVVDELDDSLHPYLVKNLISLFNDPNVNKNKAQLIFMSHAHYLMDGEHLSRDQIWLTSKELNKGFYSDLYSLSDFKNLNRKNAAFYNAYMEGIYGAVPFWERNNG
ncbi:MAG: ATP-binding protein [Alphaproteobacteria bacterium]|nr:ATP-binding protein [Alphaproteobacteria bacterium]